MSSFFLAKSHYVLPPDLSPSEWAEIYSIIVDGSALSLELIIEWK